LSTRIRCYQDEDDAFEDMTSKSRSRLRLGLHDGNLSQPPGLSLALEKGEDISFPHGSLHVPG